MGKKVRALVWEECRVGGAIAAWCVFLSVVYLVGLKWPWVASPRWTEWNELMAAPFSLGMPVLIALLLILNPNQSGHLVGGYSKRVLWLPVPTSVAVAVTLALRTAFVLLSAVVLMVVSGAVFEGAPTTTLVLFFVLLYLAAQLLDWLRGPVSGLSSAILAGVAAATIVLLARGSDVMDAIGSIQTPAWGASVLFAVGALAAAYGVSVAAVHATRVGWRVGIPEIWEWPQRIEIGKTRTMRAFSSPVAAQFWFEWHQAKWVLPLGTAAIWSLIVGTVWVSGARDTEYLRVVASLAPFPALLIAAAAHGVVTQVMGRRKTRRNPGFQYHQSLTSAEIASAKALTNMAALVPTVIAVTIFHVALAGGTFLRDVIPFAYESGAASTREIAWVLVNRGILIGLIAWPLAAIGTRSIGAVTAVVFSTPILGSALLEMGLFNTGTMARADTAAAFRSANWLALPFLVLACVGVYWRAWRMRTIPSRAVFGWGCAWVLTAWLLRAALPDGPLDIATSPAHHAQLLLMCLGFAALVPLPYAAIALDVTRRRHGAVNPQDPEQHAGRARSTSVLVSVTLSAAAILAIWLGWRGEPAYFDYLRAKGWPATLDELNASYAVVPPDSNVALRYIAVADTTLGESVKYLRQGRGPHPSDPDGRMTHENFADFVRDVVSMGGPIPPHVLEQINDYWSAVTSHVAPELKQIAAHGAETCRYPVDLREGFNAEMPHLAKLRALDRELYVDTVYWAAQGNAQEATRAVLAFLPLQESLKNEPLPVSQLTRIRILSDGIDAIEALMNLTTVTDEQLRTLRQGFASALAPPDEGTIMDIALRGQCAMDVSYVDMWSARMTLSGNYLPSGVDPLWIARGLAVSPAAERMAILHVYALKNEVPVPAARARRSRDARPEIPLFAPLSAVLTPSLSGFYVAEARIRMQIDIAEAAIAVEQFRRAEGRLPESLDELVPVYLAAPPLDIYTQNDPVSYEDYGEPMDNGSKSFVIFSVGRNGTEDVLMKDTEKRREKDNLSFKMGLSPPERKLRRAHHEQMERDQLHDTSKQE